MKNDRSRLNRRKFLAASACAISAPLFMPGRIFGFNGGVSPSNKINLFHIGLGNRGNELLGGFLGNPNYHVLVLGAPFPHSCRYIRRAVAPGPVLGLRAATHS